MPVPTIRIREIDSAPLRPERGYVLYWMTAFRRLRDNFALERACEHARALDRPLLVLEALRCGYAWSCDRFHAFVLAGMRDNAAQAGKAGIGYYPYVEPRPGAGKGLLATLVARACVVVTDDYPAFFHPRMLGAAARALDVRLEAVDSNGLLPIRLAGRAFARAHDFRRFLQRELPGHLEHFPARAPLRNVGRAPLPRAATARWPAGIPDRLDRPECLAPRLFWGSILRRIGWDRAIRSERPLFARGRLHGRSPFPTVTQCCLRSAA